MLEREIKIIEKFKALVSMRAKSTKSGFFGSRARAMQLRSQT